MGHERWSYKPEVPESQAGLGTIFGCVVFIGSTLVLQTKSGDSTSPASTRFGGHGSVAESDIASVGARVRFPLTAPGFRDVGYYEAQLL